MTRSKFAVLLLLMLLSTRCGKTVEADPPDYPGILSGICFDVILKTYNDLDTKAGALQAVAEDLLETPTNSNLQACRQAWRDVRGPWELCEGFLFGPVVLLGSDPDIDSWPINEVDLNNVMASNVPLTKTYLDSQQGTIKGFHTIEYLLFSSDGTKEITEFTPRELEYLVGCTGSLKGEAHRVYTNWLPTGGNYVSNLLKAGTSESVYPSQKDALIELVNGMATICDELANVKINEPLAQKNVFLEESRFSGNTKTDFVNNLKGLRNVYFGSTTEVNTASISAVAALRNSALDTKIKSQIESAIMAIENIPGVFTTAIFEHPDDVAHARDTINQLLQTLQSELLPFIEGL